MALILLFFAMVEAGLAVDSYAPRHGHGPSSARTSLLVFLRNRTTSRASHRSRRSARNSSPCGGARHARPATAPQRRPTLQSTRLEGGEAKWSFGLWGSQASTNPPQETTSIERFLLISSLHELLNTHLKLLRSKFPTLAVTCFPVFWWEKIFRSQVVLYDIAKFKTGRMS